MESLSKTPITFETAQAIAVTVFGGQTHVSAMRELPDGLFNAAYVLELADGRLCVVKIAPPPDVPVMRYERAIMYAEVDAVQLVRRHTCIPAPEVYAFDTSCRLTPAPYMVMEFLPGTSLFPLRAELTSAEQFVIDFQAGAYMRHMNEITGTTFGLLAPGAPQFTSWRAAFFALLEDVFSDGEDLKVTLPYSPDVLYQQMLGWAGELDEIVTPRLVHWDLWDGNIFVDPQSKRISGILDFERALWGDPLTENPFRPMVEPHGFMQGYGRAMLDTVPKRRRRVLYNIYLYLIMIVECAFRQYPTDDQIRWVLPQLEDDLQRLAGLRPL